MGNTHNVPDSDVFIIGFKIFQEKRSLWVHGIDVCADDRGVNSHGELRFEYYPTRALWFPS